MSLLIKATRENIKKRADDEKLEKAEYKGEKELKNIDIPSNHVSFIFDNELKRKIQTAFGKLTNRDDPISINLFSNMFFTANGFESTFNIEEDYDFLLKIINSMFRQIENTFPYYKENDKKDTIVLLYSGGRDSTLLLLDALQKGYRVYIIFNMFNFDSFLYESHYTGPLFQLFSALYNILILEEKYRGQIYFERKHCNQLNLGTFTGAALSQQPFNAFSIFAVPAKVLTRTKEVWMGLISGDDGLILKNELIDLYKAAMKFNWTQREVLSKDDKEIFTENIKIPPLVFPLAKISKEDIMHKWDEYNDPFIKRLIQLTCTEPDISFHYKRDKKGYIKYIYLKYSECGNCCNCKHLKTGIKSKYFNPSNKPYFIKIYDFDKIYNKKTTTFINKSNYKYFIDDPRYQHIGGYLLELIENYDKYDKFFPDEKNDFKNLKEIVNKHLERYKSIKHSGLVESSAAVDIESYSD